MGRASRFVFLDGGYTIPRRTEKRRTMRKLLVAAIVAGSVILPSSHAFAATSAPCLNHSLTTDTSARSGQQVFIDENASKCATGLGLRVKVAQWVSGPTHRTVLGPVQTFLGNRDVVTFYPVSDVGTYTVITRITTPSGRLLAVDTGTFEVTA